MSDVGTSETSRRDPVESAYEDQSSRAADTVLAEETDAEIKRIDPPFSVTQFANAQPYRDTGVLEKLVSNRRSAGVPE